MLEVLRKLQCTNCYGTFYTPEGIDPKCCPYCCMEVDEIEQVETEDDEEAD